MSSELGDPTFDARTGMAGNYFSRHRPHDLWGNLSTPYAAGRLRGDCSPQHDHSEGNGLTCWRRSKVSSTTTRMVTQVVTPPSDEPAATASTQSCAAGESAGSKCSGRPVARDDRDVPLLTHNPLKGLATQAETVRGGRC